MFGSPMAVVDEMLLLLKSLTSSLILFMTSIGFCLVPSKAILHRDFYACQLTRTRVAHLLSLIGLLVADLLCRRSNNYSSTVLTLDCSRWIAIPPNQMRLVQSHWYIRGSLISNSLHKGHLRSTLMPLCVILHLVSTLTNLHIKKLAFGGAFASHIHGYTCPSYSWWPQLV